MKRRSFVTTLSAAMAVAASRKLQPSMTVRAADADGWHVSTNSYVWGTFARRDGKSFGNDWENDLQQVVKGGMDGFEPGIGSVAQLDEIADWLQRRGLEMRSMYVGTQLHEADGLDERINHVIQLAERARALCGTSIVVNNPAPMGGGEAKNDDQLGIQRNALERLGRGLRAVDMTLAYHNHDVELRHGAREFHHMLAGSDPEAVSFCLDAHWVYRGCGNSQAALFDVVELYADRIVELHLRQSQDGVWTEAFVPGDIDYERLGRELEERGIRPLLVLEQAVEAATPHTMNAVEAHLASEDYLRRCFGWMES